jgi:AmiR/NasT family two-component response regulator
MKRHKIDRKLAFEALRVKARSERRTLVEVASELVDSLEKLNSYNKLGENTRGGK